MKLVSSIKMCVIETYIQSPGKQNIRLLCFLLKMVWNKEMFYRRFFSTSIGSSSP